MGGLERLLAMVVPAPAALFTSIGLQALIFGMLHSYTASRAYLIAATVAGALFGGAFALTRNLVVPCLMHFILDLVAFVFCHVQVTRATEDEKERLINDASPIATALRLTFGPPSSEMLAITPSDDLENAKMYVNSSSQDEGQDQGRELP